MPFKCCKVHEIVSDVEVLYVYIKKFCGSWIQLWSLLYTFPHCEVSDQLVMVDHVIATVTEERRIFNILYLWKLTKITHCSISHDYSEAPFMTAYMSCKAYGEIIFTKIILLERLLNTGFFFHKVAYEWYVISSEMF